jgi:nucleotide-binding universal stress UspA family protein
MYKKILVATDGSEVGNGAFEAAMQLAKTQGAELLPLYVVEHPDIYVPDVGYDPSPIYDAFRAEGEEVRKKADAQMKREGVKGKTQVVDNFIVRKTVAGQIQDTADALQADLVVLGTHGRSGFKRLMLGSVAEAFVRISTRPVLLVPQRSVGSSTDD